MTKVAEARLWYENPTILVGVAQVALDNGSLERAQDVIDFFEKPWQWPEFHEAWREAIDQEKARFGETV